MRTCGFAWFAVRGTCAQVRQVRFSIRQELRSDNWSTTTQRYNMNDTQPSDCSHQKSGRLTQNIYPVKPVDMSAIVVRGGAISITPHLHAVEVALAGQVGGGDVAPMDSGKGRCVGVGTAMDLASVPRRWKWSKSAKSAARGRSRSEAEQAAGQPAAAPADVRQQNLRKRTWL